MRIVLAVGTLGAGGTERQVVNLATGLHDAGHDVTVAHLFGDGPLLDDLGAAGVPTWSAGFPARRDASPRTLAAAARRYRRWLRQQRPDVLHAFLFDTYLVSVPLARAARVPVVVAGRRSLSHFKAGRGVLRHVEPVANLLTHGIVANSDAVAADAVATERFAGAKVTVIRNGVDFDPRTKPRSAVAATASPPTIACVANLIAYKGHIDLLDAMTALRDEHGTPVRAVLVGVGPEQERLEAIVEDRGLDVTFAGHQRDVVGVLLDADVFVLASHEEGSSNAVVEAMGAGVPVVVTDVGGNREAVGQAGVLVPPHDPAALAAGIAGLLADDERRAGLADDARRQARDRFSLRAMVAAHEHYYDGLLGGRRRRRR